MDSRTHGSSARSLRVRAGSARADSSETFGFEHVGRDAGAAVTDAYHAKYDRYGPRIVGTVVSPESVDSTIRLEAR
jgi:hypothetical protein